MADTHITLTSTRTTRPDNIAMTAAVRTAVGDPTAVLLSFDGVTATGKKATAWTAAQIDAAQAIFDTADELSPQVVAQREIDRFPIEFRALVLTLIDEVNILRTHAAIGLAPRTPTQAITAIRNKASTLS
jgi:hypothetical protein